MNPNFPNRHLANLDMGDDYGGGAIYAATVPIEKMTIATQKKK
jgi:hypothetical protein